MSSYIKSIYNLKKNIKQNVHIAWKEIYFNFVYVRTK